jgi:hypothetical protein
VNLSLQPYFDEKKGGSWSLPCVVAGPGFEPGTSRL